MDDDTAIDGLKRLGLTAYEARVFLGLQKLGSGTASDVSEVVDVPRSQVYGAAENLEERGLVEIQQSTPTRYRPVPLEQARRRLLDQLAETGSETFEYLDTVQETEATEERSEAIWQVRGSDAVVSRGAELAASAEEYVLYSCSEASLLEAELLEALAKAQERGVKVVVASANPAVRDGVPEAFETTTVPPDRDPDVGCVRTLLADEETMLLGVTVDSSVESESEEVAFWSSGTAFAAVLGGFIARWFHEPMARD